MMDDKRLELYYLISQLNVLNDMQDIHAGWLIGNMNQRSKMLLSRAIKAWDMYLKYMRRGDDGSIADLSDEIASKHLELFYEAFKRDDKIDEIIEYVKSLDNETITTGEDTSTDGIPDIQDGDQPKE